MRLTRDMFRTNKDFKDLLKKYEIIQNPDALDNKQLSCLRSYLFNNPIRSIEDLADSTYFNVYDILDAEGLDYGNYDGINERSKLSEKRIKNRVKSFKDFLYE